MRKVHYFISRLKRFENCNKLSLFFKMSDIYDRFWAYVTIGRSLIIVCWGWRNKLSQDGRWILAIGPHGVKPESIHNR